FKSATEPFRYNKMSDQNRLQLHEFLDNLYLTLLNDVSDSRKISVDSLRAIAYRYDGQTADGSVKSGLIDGIMYPDEFSDMIKKKVGLKSKDDLEKITLGEYAGAKPIVGDFGSKDKIALVYAEGGIEDGDGKNGTIGGDKYAQMIKKLRMDENVKAIVLRVNSPGGSALASDLIWREIEMAKKAKIPVIVSMGDYAASGGYYIACNADSILAEPNTLTGSIGVFALLPNARKLMNEKLGITFDTVATGPNAIGISPFAATNPDQDRMIQSWIDNTYERFLDHVSKGRKMTRDQVHEIAQGRIWTGDKAVQLGLVDRLGTLDDAIKIAAKMAKVDKYRVSEYPRPKNQIMQIMEELMGKSDEEDDVKSKLIQSTFKEYASMYNFLRDVQKMQGPQARLPFYLEIK
ncbi:MAG: signal peptide peptidase SppA, partial [Saprospiraceae bacterium]